jgi:hypothetical protein
MEAWRLGERTRERGDISQRPKDAKQGGRGLCADTSPLSHPEKRFAPDISARSFLSPQKLRTLSSEIATSFDGSIIMPKFRAMSSATCLRAHGATSTRV